MSNINSSQHPKFYTLTQFTHNFEYCFACNLQIALHLWVMLLFSILSRSLGWYVAGYAVISKIIPVCFAFIFSLSGAVGPILGQNYGAKEWRRIKRAMLDAPSKSSILYIDLYYSIDVLKFINIFI